MNDIVNIPANTLINDNSINQKLVDYIESIMKTKITIPEYLNLINIMGNKSNQLDGFNFYVALITDPDTVFKFNLTPKEIIANENFAYYRSIKSSWDKIITKYGSLSPMDRIDFMNTVDPDLYSTNKLLDEASRDKQIYLFQNAFETLKEITYHKFSSGANLSDAKKDKKFVEDILNKFYGDVNRFSQYYDIYQPDVGTDFNKVNFKETLNNIEILYKGVDELEGTMVKAGGVLSGIGIMLVGAGVTACAHSLVPLGVVLIVIGGVLIAGSVTCFAVDLVLKHLVTQLDDLKLEIQNLQSDEKDVI